MKWSFLKKGLFFAVLLAIVMVNIMIHTEAQETREEIIGDQVLSTDQHDEKLSEIEDEPAILPEEEVLPLQEEILEDKGPVGYILIGDSRFVMMENSMDMSKHPDVFIIAKGSQGYKWLVSTAIPQARRIIKENKQFKGWKVAINLGVNDLGRREKYKSLYQDLVEEWDLHFVSVNPVRDYKRVSNKSIVVFNSAFRDIEGLSYINTYKTMMEKGFGTTDGCHYTNKTSRDIFGYVMEELRK